MDGRVAGDPHHGHRPLKTTHDMGFFFGGGRGGSDMGHGGKKDIDMRHGISLK